jgi:hypothetical protein
MRQSIIRYLGCAAWGILLAGYNSSDLSPSFAEHNGQAGTLPMGLPCHLGRHAHIGLPKGDCYYTIPCRIGIRYGIVCPERSPPGEGDHTDKNCESREPFCGKYAWQTIKIQVIG